MPSHSVRNDLPCTLHRITDVVLLVRISAVSVNVPCRHIFCAQCIIHRWARHVGSTVAGLSEDFLCPKCDAPLLPIVDRAKRSMLNIPICKDRTVERLITQMSEDVSRGIKEYSEELIGIAGAKGRDMIGEWSSLGPGWNLRKNYEKQVKRLL